MTEKSKESADFQIINAFNGIEVVTADYKKQTFSKHVHEGYTIGIIEQGAQRFYRSGCNHVADQNSIILVNADDVHTGESATPNGWQYKALYPTPEHFEIITQDLYEGKRHAPYFNNAVLNDKQLASQLKVLFSQIELGSSRLLVETILYSIMMQMTLNHSTLRNIPREISGSKQRLSLVKEYLDSYPEEDISLEKLAIIAGLSQFHFIRQFKNTFDLTPHSYQIQARLKKAKDLLKVGIKPAQVAADCGFHDQSHFNRHFKKALGTTPRKFQKQAVLYKS